MLKTNYTEIEFQIHLCARAIMLAPSTRVEPVSVMSIEVLHKQRTSCFRAARRQSLSQVQYSIVTHKTISFISSKVIRYRIKI